MTWLVAAALLTGLSLRLAWSDPVAVGALTRMVRGLGPPEQTTRLGSTTRGGLALVALAVGILLVPGAAGLGVAPILAGVTWLVSGRMESPAVLRARRELVLEMPQALSLLASALLAGSPPRVAVRQVAEVSGTRTRELLESVAGHVQVGCAEPEAWLALADDPVAGPVWGRAARDLARNAHSGAAVVELLELHAEQALAVRRARVERQARTVGVQSVLPMTACFLPAFVLVGVVPIIAGLLGNFRF